MNRRYIVPVEPASGSGDVVVIQVHQNGDLPLDMLLVGCEGENPYVRPIKHRDIGSLKHSFKGTDTEWVALLSLFFLQKPPGQHDIPKGVRLVYNLSDDEIELLLRQDIKGIKVTLGKIALVKDDDYELNPFEWAQASAQAHARTLQEMEALRARVSEEQDSISKLKAQLEDFIKTKDETEREMLQQFMQLLNEKKRKIRDQNRLLAGAKVDESTASAIQSTREETKPRKAGASRTSKRKASKTTEPETIPKTEPPSDPDQMEIDQAKAEEQMDESGPEAATPDQTTDGETEDEDEDMASAAIAAPSASQVRGDSSKPASLQPRKGHDAQDTGPPPARRELPFGRPATRGTKTAPKKTPSPANDDETEDEEL